ncbi:MAG TPA: hypothetical protein VD994_01200 [Prosthecobacter sp.]|nr:hypothetical protein [Prosthecobacter sp.]
MKLSLPLTTVLLIATLSACTTIPGGHFVNRDVGGTSIQHFVPDDGELAMVKNVRQFLADRQAREIVCTFSGSVTLGNQSEENHFDAFNVRSGRLTQTMIHGPLRSGGGSGASTTSVAHINGSLTSELISFLPTVSYYEIEQMAERGGGASIYDIASAATALPLVPWSSSSLGITLTPNAVMVTHPITHQSCKAARLRQSFSNYSGAVVTKEYLMRDDVPGRIISVSETMQAPTGEVGKRIELTLTGVSYR